jgi:hypothetical protein
MLVSHESLPLVPRPRLVCFGILSLGGAPMGVDYGWEKFFSSIHYAVTSAERLQQRLQGVVNGIDGLRRDSFRSDETYERFEKLMTATKMYKDATCEGQRGQISSYDFADGRVGSKTMAARSTGAILRRCSGIWKRTGTTYFFSHISQKTRS